MDIMKDIGMVGMKDSKKEQIEPSKKRGDTLPSFYFWC